MVAHTPDEVLAFWFSDATSKHWFARSDEFDARLRDVLGPLHARAAAGELDDWAATPRGALALVILLDGPIDLKLPHERPAAQAAS